MWPALTNLAEDPMLTPKNLGFKVFLLFLTFDSIEFL